MSLSISLRSSLFHNGFSNVYRSIALGRNTWSSYFPRSGTQDVSFSETLDTPWKKLGEKIGSFLESLNDCILRAVPKKKTSYSKKRMRAAGKSLKNLTNIVTCHSCGKPKLMHQLCTYCLKEFRSRARQSNETILEP